MALTRDEVRGLVGEMWRLHLEDHYALNRLRDYRDGRAGLPEIPDEAADDVKEIRRICGKNVIGVVVDAFAQNLSVTGYRRADAAVNGAAWVRWQRNRLDRRQDEVHRAALTYGVGYAVVTPGADGFARVRYRSPRDLLAVYDDLHVDEFPQFALETWTGVRDGKRVMLGMLLDEECAYPLDLGWAPAGSASVDFLAALSPDAAIGDPIPHGAGVCPVVRFRSVHDGETLPAGEVRPLIQLQQAINSVNFDRLVVSRFGAFPKHVISGWTGAPGEVVAASARRMLTFDDPDVKAQTLMGTDGKGYNDLITEMMEHVAMVAQLSPAQITGKMVNLSADALAAAERQQQRKTALLRTSFGESHETVMRLMAQIEGDVEAAADVESEVVWLDTEARSFAAVVDGVAKLAQVGVPVEDMLPMVPGLTQAQRESIRKKMSAGADFRSTMAQILEGAGADGAAADAGA